MLLSSKEETDNKKFQRGGNYFPRKTNPFQDVLLSFCITVQTYGYGDVIKRARKDCNLIPPLVKPGQQRFKFNPSVIYICIYLFM